MNRTSRIAAWLGAGLVLGACATTPQEPAEPRETWPALLQHQCEREAANRPDEVQRRAECQLRSTGRGAPRSQPPNA